MESLDIHSAEGQTPSQQVRLPHSGLGISSFVLSMASWFCFFVVLVVAGFDLAAKHAGQSRPGALLAVGAVAALVSALLALVGVGLGIAGVTTRKRNRLFGFLGLGFGLFILLIFALLVVAARHR